MKMKNSIPQPTRHPHIPRVYCIFVNGNWHSDVEAFSEEHALDKMVGNIGYYVHEISAELLEGTDEPEEAGYPRSLYGN